MFGTNPLFGSSCHQFCWIFWAGTINKLPPFIMSISSLGFRRKGEQAVRFFTWACIRTSGNIVNITDVISPNFKVVLAVGTIQNRTRHWSFSFFTWWIHYNQIFLKNLSISSEIKRSLPLTSLSERYFTAFSARAYVLRNVVICARSNFLKLWAGVLVKINQYIFKTYERF